LFAAALDLPIDVAGYHEHSNATGSDAMAIASQQVEGQPCQV
jgi:hypothetical protein